MQPEEPELFIQAGHLQRPDPSPASAPQPDSGRANWWLWIGIFVAVIGGFALLGQAGNVIGELYARVKWTRVTGFVDSARLCDAAQRDSPGNATGSHTFYWAEFEVSFQPAQYCGARRSAVNTSTGTISCQGKIISHPEITPSDAEGWLNRHGRGQPAELLYDPGGAGVKFANESLVNSMEWTNVFVGLLFVGIGGGIAVIARRQRRESANQEKVVSAI